MPIAELTIGQVARRTGLAVSAIRYYEAQGLVQSNRNAGGQRRFRKADLRRLSFVIIAQGFGFTIARIRELLENLPDARTPTESDWNRIAGTFRAELDQRIETLTKLRDSLDGCIGCGCLSMKKCALYNPADRAARNGSGPRYLMGDRAEAVEPDA
ncbi:redox-sensitive transcriptional activator SoxR [Halovulum sp. GXIMD14793]